MERFAKPLGKPAPKSRLRYAKPSIVAAAGDAGRFAATVLPGPASVQHHNKFKRLNMRLVTLIPDRIE